jgi:hypothetical protein
MRKRDLIDYDGHVPKDVVEGRRRLVDDSKVDLASEVQRGNHCSW